MNIYDAGGKWSLLERPSKNGASFNNMQRDMGARLRIGST